jgi:hypothetical protein
VRSIGYQDLIRRNISYKADNLSQKNREILDETRTLFGLMSSQSWLLKSISRQQHMVPALYFGECTYKQSRVKTLSSKECYEKRKMYDFGCGLLSFQAFKVRSADGSIPFRGRDSMRLKLSFQPRAWLSRTSLQATIDIPG